MKYKVISFYTEFDPNSKYYTHHAKRLIGECKNFNIDHHIVEVPSMGNYYANTRMKPQFVLDAMNEFKTPLIWLDVDSYITRPIDVKSYYAHDFAGVKRNLKDSIDYPIFAHCLYFNNTSSSIKLLNEWVRLCSEMHGRVGDHSQLVNAMRNTNIEYAFIHPNFTQYKINSSKENHTIGGTHGHSNYQSRH